MSRATTLGCVHAEAFCLMPFGGCPTRDGADELTHHDFAGDRFAPGHRPKAGDRIFVSQTKAGATLRRRVWLTERWTGQEEWDVLLRERYPTIEEAVLRFDDWKPGTPALSEVGPELRLGPWFDGERWRACVPGVGDQVVRGRVVEGLRELGAGLDFLDHDRALRAYCAATGEEAPTFHPRPQPRPMRFA